MPRGFVAAVGALFCIVVVSLSNAVRAEEPQPGEPVEGLQLSLKIQDRVIEVGEKIPFALEFQNVSDTGFSICPVRLGDTFGISSLWFFVQKPGSLKVYTPSELIVDGFGSPCAGDYLVLEPGESLSRDLEMDPSTLVEKDTTTGNWNVGSPLLSMAAGSYEVSVRLELGKDPVGPDDAWEGTVVSNHVTVEVVEGATE